MKGQPLPAPLPGAKVSPHHHARLAAWAGFRRGFFLLERTLMHSRPHVCPLPAKLTMSNPWYDSPVQVEMEPLSRTQSCSPPSADCAKEAKPCLAPI